MNLIKLDVSDPRESTDYFIITCTGTKAAEKLSARDALVNDMREGWADAVCHYIIERDGKVTQMKKLTSKSPCVFLDNPAFAKTERAVLIKLVGGKGIDGKPANNFTKDQRRELLDLLIELHETYPPAKIVTIQDIDKRCKKPCKLDVKSFG